MVKIIWYEFLQYLLPIYETQQMRKHIISQLHYLDPAFMANQGSLFRYHSSLLYFIIVLTSYQKKTRWILFAIMIMLFIRFLLGLNYRNLKTSFHEITFFVKAEMRSMGSILLMVIIVILLVNSVSSLEMTS